MGQSQSKKKKKLLFEQVRSGNVEGIRALCQDGANLEWMDKEGNTPLILASMDKKLYDVAQALIKLGANVNARRLYLSYNETPLYLAASRGLENTVKLLLSNGANSDRREILQMARKNKLTNIVRAIESHFCLFSGWMREFYGHAILNVVAPQWRSRSVWVVVILHSATYQRPELFVYASLQDAHPRVVMALSPNLKEPNGMHPDTSVTIIDFQPNTTSPQKKI